MFALGCIIYEILTGRKLFESDWSVLEYWQSATSIFPDLWPPCFPQSRAYGLGMLTSSLLTNEATRRPGANQTKRYLQNIGQGLDPFAPSDSPTLTEDTYLEDTSSFILPEGPPVIQTAFRKNYQTAPPPPPPLPRNSWNAIQPPSNQSMGVPAAPGPVPHPDALVPVSPFLPQSLDFAFGQFSALPPLTPRYDSPVPTSIEELANLAGDMNAQTLSDDRLKSIIIKSEQGQTYTTLKHLTRNDLVKRVDDLVDSWRWTRGYGGPKSRPPMEHFPVPEIQKSDVAMISGDNLPSPWHLQVPKWTGLNGDIESAFFPCTRCWEWKAKVLVP